MKPKKPQECWMPMSTTSGEIAYFDAAESRAWCVSNMKFYPNQSGFIPVKIQLIPVIKKRGKK